MKWLKSVWGAIVTSASIMRQLGSGMSGFEKFVMIMLGLVLAGMTACSEKRSSYRLTYVVETPEGERRGAQVIETWRALGGGVIGRFSFGFRGEAAFIDLGKGRNLVALLAHGPRGEDVDRHVELASEVYRDELRQLCAGKDTSWGCAVRDFGRYHFPPRALPLEMIPTLVTFTDLNNPASARVVYATSTEERWDHSQGLVRVGKVFVDRLTEAFGPGYGLKEVRLEMVSSGLWPFNLLPIPFPQALFGTPIITGIEGKMPMLVTHRERLRNQRTAPSDPYIAQFHQFIRE